MFIFLLIAFVWNCSVYSGTVAGAREAFFYGLPSVSISYDWYVSTYANILHIIIIIKKKKKKNRRVREKEKEKNWATVN